MLDEKYTMTAAATAVQEITLTFSKAVADTTAAKITVKKGTSNRTFTTKWADDKKSAVLAMDAKLTKGTYDVTVSGVEKEDLTASVAVEDQKLAGFELLSTNLVAGALPVTYGTIKFKGVDQYGNTMKAGNVTVSSSFGTLYTAADKMNAEANATNTFTTSTNPTTVYVKITSAMAILGTKGTITIVGTNNGANLTSEITLVEPSKATKVENLGLYNTKEKKFKDMTAGDTVSDYVIALKFTNQYDVELSYDEAKAQNISVTVAGGTTTVDKKSANPEKVTIDGKDVYAIRLASSDSNGKAKAGTMLATVVNPTYGLLDNLSFTVAPGTVIKSFSVSADNEIYAGEKNILSYTAIDAEGNEVTKYDTLSRAFTGKVMKDGKEVEDIILPTGVDLEKQADGTAKLVYNPSTTAKNKEYTGSELVPLMFTLYPGATNILVAQTTVKVNQARVIWEVKGINASAITATASKGAITLKPTDITIADQYGNTLTSDQIGTAWKGKTNLIKVENKTGWTVAGDKNLTAKDSKITFTPASEKAEDVEFTVYAEDNGEHKDDGFKLKLSKVDAKDASDFAIEWNNEIKTFSVSSKSLSLKAGSDFKVVGKVNGKKVEIPNTNYVVLSGASQDKAKADVAAFSKTATLKVAVSYGDNKTQVLDAEYTYSNEASKLTKIDAGTNTKVVKDGIDVNGLLQTDADNGNAFKLLDQYGMYMSSAPADLTADFSLVAGKGSVKYNGTNKAIISGTDENTKFVVTLTCGDLTKTVTITK